MPLLLHLAPFIPFFALIPPSLAAMWIASRWLKTRGTSPELRAEVAELREEIAELRQTQADVQERLDFAERLLSQARESHRELPKGS